MIKVTNIVSLIAAPIIVKYSKMTIGLAARRGRPARRDRLGHLEEQARGPVAVHRDQREGI